MTQQTASPTQRKTSAPRTLLVALAVMVFLGAAGAAGYFLMADARPLAVLTGGQEGTQRDSARTVGQWTTAERGDEFQEGDGARTQDRATALFRLETGAQLTLRPSSQVRFQRSAGTDEIGLDVEVGEADISTDQRRLIIDSEFGPLLLRPGSEITLRRRGARLAVDVEVGRVQLGKEGRQLGAGTSVELEVGGLVVEPNPSPGNTAAPENPETDDEPDPELDVGDGVERVDLVVRAGQSFTVHDPSPPTRLGVRFDGVCDGPGRLSIGDAHTEAEKQGNLKVEGGRHRYEVRCLDDPDEVSAEGSFVVVADSGMRNLPTFAPQANVATDGRRYTVLYQHRLPRVTVTWPSAPESTTYALSIDGQTIETKSPTLTKTLQPGTHQLAFSAPTNPPRRSRTTTVRVLYDTQAPKARVANPPNGFAPGASVAVAGQALPGWSVSLNGNPLDVDEQRRFSTETSTDGTLSIAFSHPTHGVHYYLRRPSTTR